ncbi:hypothetical protein GCM10025794_02100 [Massilia kyonggiensis]|nr:DUF4435 domain-containing protein [Massilia kyonggiensis]
MEEYITADRIANAICQDITFNGCSVLVEGKKDIKLYSRFFDKEHVRLVQTFGKYKQRAAYQILADRGFARKLGIRDADFLRIDGNAKYDPNYAEDIFPTDCHDSEVMVFISAALDHFITGILDQNRVDQFEKEMRKPLREVALELAYTLGCLKLANKRHALGLSFKPEKADGNRLKFSKFIDAKTGQFLGNDLLVNTVYEYSKNRGLEVASRQAISEKLLFILAAKHPALEIVNGHDICEIISLLSKDALKSNNKALQIADCVEDMLRLAFDSAEFFKTGLASKLRAWQESSGNQLFI